MNPKILKTESLERAMIGPHTAFLTRLRAEPAEATLEPARESSRPRTVTVAGVERLYLLFVPERPDPTVPAPLILALHGGGSSPEHMAKVTLLSARAAAHGFAIAYLQACQKFWNTGERYAGLPKGAAGGDDIAFARAVIEDVRTALQVDSRRIYAAGFSNGGKMAYRLACEMSESLAAVGVVASSLGPVSRPPRHAVSVVHFHGTADDLNPYEGGRGHSQHVQAKQRGARRTVAQWVRWNGCSERPIVTWRQPPVTLTSYGYGRDAAEVRLYTIEGMGHQWPGETIAKPARLARFLGPGTEAISATDIMIKFFLLHPAPARRVRIPGRTSGRGPAVRPAPGRRGRRR